MQAVKEFTTERRDRISRDRGEVGGEEKLTPYTGHQNVRVWPVMGCGRIRSLRRDAESLFYFPREEMAGALLVNTG